MAANERILLTPAGKQDLEDELRRLRTVEHPQMMRRIQELSESGDVSDDSDFEVTKEELVQLEARIREIEVTLADAEIVSYVGGSDVVEFGSTVTIVNSEGKDLTWTIVSQHEANTTKGRISHVSPIGSALLGKRVGEKVLVKAPAGEFEYIVKAVS